MSTSFRLRVRLTETNRRTWLTLFLFTLGLVLAFVAQRGIYESGNWQAGAFAYVCAFTCLIASWVRDGDMLTLPIRQPLHETILYRAHPARAWFVLPAFLFALIAFFELENNVFTLTGTLAWLAALATFLFAFWQGTPIETVRNLSSALKRQSRWTMLALAGIVLVGALFYFYQLDAVPAEMTSDHAEKILDTYDVLNGKYSVFFERNTGREPLQFYLNALVVALGLAPLDMLALKIVGAGAGVLTIPGVFLLGREMFDDEVGLLAAFLFAVSIFPLAIARIGLRYPLSPLFVAWTCFFLLYAMRTQSRNAFLMAGLLLGAGLNGYSPFRVVVLLALLWCATWLIWGFVRIKNQTRFAVNLSLMFGAALLVFVPLLRYLYENPAMFSYRMATRLTSLEIPITANPWQTFLDNNLRAFGMFNIHGDVVWVNALPSVPVVDFILGVCFLVGIVYSAYRLVRCREYPYALMFGALFILLLPSTLAIAFPEENPSVVRAGGTTVFVMMFAALPFALWRKQFVALRTRTLGDVLLGLVLLATAALNFDLYFNRYDEQYRSVAWNSNEISDALREFAREHDDWEHIYIVSAPHWVDHRAVGIHLGNFDFDAHLIQDEDTLYEQVNDPAPKMYALKNQDLSNLLLLQDLYPSGYTEPIPSRTLGRDFVVFYTVPR